MSVSTDFLTWIHDDVTWCIDNDCPIINCMRNTKNMMNHAGLHSYANFKETDECPIYRMEQAAAAERGEDC